MRMLPHLRQVLTALNVRLLPAQVTVAKAAEAFHPDGSLVSERYVKQVQDLADELVQELTLRLRVSQPLTR
ncbi:hypothetical protein D3C72_2247360 [compost metagenome]